MVVWRPQKHFQIYRPVRGAVKKKYGIIWEFFPTFFACQIHSEVLKHVLQRGVVIYDQFYHLKFI